MSVVWPGISPRLVGRTWLHARRQTGCRWVSGTVCARAAVGVSGSRSVTSRCRLWHRAPVSATRRRTPEHSSSVWPASIEHIPSSTKIFNTWALLCLTFSERLVYVFYSEIHSWRHYIEQSKAQLRWQKSQPTSGIKAMQCTDRYLQCKQTTHYRFHQYE